MAKKPGLRIDVRVDVLMDERYDALSDIAGYNRHEALGRMFALWAWCLDKQEFVLHEAIVRRFLGPRGVEAILGEVAPGEIVDSLALGERREGGIYVRGSESLAWLGERRAAASKGGEARALAARAADGSFTGPDSRGRATPISEDALEIGQEAPAKHRNRVTYAIADSYMGAVKIGFTSNLRGRVETLQTASPGRLVVLGTIEGNYETALHTRLSHRRMSGEWFEMCDEVIAVLTGIGMRITRVPAKRHPTSIQATSQTPPNIQPSDSDLLSDPDLEEREKNARPSAAPTLALVPPAPKRKRSPKPVVCTDAERASVETVLAKLSEQSGVTWTFCDTHARLILARLRDGVTEWDLRLVIGYCASPKSAGGLGWRDDEKMAVYLRPATLFGPEKIHDYLPQARAWYERYVDDKQRKGTAS